MFTEPPCCVHGHARFPIEIGEASGWNVLLRCDEITILWVELIGDGMSSHTAKTSFRNSKEAIIHNDLWLFFFDAVHEFKGFPGSFSLEVC